MGRQARMKRERRQGLLTELDQQVMQARQVWLGKRVRFDLGHGDGVQYGRVVFITDEGDVFVACEPGSGSVAALAFTLGYLHVLTLVDEESDTASY